METMVEHRLDEIIDVMRVPATGDPSVAVIATATGGLPIDVDCEVLVVGGGTGGVAAALAAVRRGRRVCLLEETDWLGGQLTAQGISAFDEHEHIESFGGTASYYALRESLRSHYLALAESSQPAFNPGACWVTRLAFEPRVAVVAIDALLQPFVESGRLRIERRMKAFAVTTQADRIIAVTVLGLDDGRVLHCRPAIVIDATELGDLLPLAGIEHVVGAETVTDTGEPHAQPQEPKPDCVQSLTYAFAVERRPAGERHAIPQPEKYVHYRESQPYSLTIEVHGGEIYGEESGWLAYRLLEKMPGTKGSLFTYRRLIDRSLFGGHFPHDVSMVNWPGNDYRDKSILQCSARAVAAALQDAKRVSLGFLHWLQTEAPAEGDRRGGPELRLRPDVMGTGDGLCKFPYIREARRILALKTIVEQELSTACQPGPRAAPFADSCGIGWYPIDIHRSGSDDVGASCRTRPFQIPLGALLPRRMENVLAAAKNIGATHITNGCYRLHPVEWNIGEAAGALAAAALDRDVIPRRIHAEPTRLADFQASLLAEGVPLAWIVDVGVTHPAFAAVQRLFLRLGAVVAPDLDFRPDDPIAPAEWHTWGGEGSPPTSRAEAALRLDRSSAS
jgi:hypothetical protein